MSRLLSCLVMIEHALDAVYRASAERVVDLGKSRISLFNTDGSAVRYDELVSYPRTLKDTTLWNNSGLADLYARRTSLEKQWENHATALAELHVRNWCNAVMQRLPAELRQHVYDELLARAKRDEARARQEDGVHWDGRKGHFLGHSFPAWGTSGFPAVDPSRAPPRWGLGWGADTEDLCGQEFHDEIMNWETEKEVRRLQSMTESEKEAEVKEARRMDEELREARWAEDDDDEYYYDREDWDDYDIGYHS